jgi:C4-dicarboxylate transporter DctM subunit
MGLIYLEAKRRKVPLEARPSFRTAISAISESFLALLTPLIILGGILLGVFTATEAAVVAVIYAALISMYVYREITLRDLGPIILRSAKTSAAVMFLIGVASLFAWVTAREQIPAMIMDLITGISSGPWLFLLMVNIVFLILGSVLEGAPAIIIFVPMIMPVAMKMGIDPIHFGIVLVANLGLGFILPPMGLCLLIACSIGKVKMADTVKPMFPYLLVKFISVMLITYASWFSLSIPRLIGYLPIGKF